ncbi:MAG: S46 family peptidase [Melioribacteraceae bacterium]|nr:S46 family peptidase [Melioribacteraceae bacterium]
MKIKRFILTLLLIISTTGMISPELEEGMYPLSEIQKVDLVKAGLKITPKDIYDPEGISLIDALVKVGGCTGSFVSDQGLIITNHHCAFRAINMASSPENNHLENGFLAADKSNEIPARGYKCRITESYEDVSDIILDAVEGVDDLAERKKLISRKMSELGEKYSDKENSIEAQVSEMFAGQSYVLFKYRIIEDVRLVYAPPRAIGEFGGESDNWIWPRHTGDFTFMRAYVAPDGSSAPYAEDNVPFKPKKYLKVNPNGVEEGDFVFILGYPGRTYRHQPSQFLEWQYNYMLPYVSELYEWMIDLIEDVSSGDEAMQLKYASTIKGYANTMKNYKGKIKGIRTIQLIEKKQSEEELLKQFVYNNKELNDKYGMLFDEIENVSQNQFKIAEALLWFNRFPRVSGLMNVGDFLVRSAIEKEKPDEERSFSFRDANIESAKRRVEGSFELLNEDVEFNVLVKMFEDALGFDESNRITAIDEIFNDDEFDIEGYVEYLLLNTKLKNKDEFEKLFELTYSELLETSDPLIKLILMLNVQDERLEHEVNRIEGAFSRLMPQLAEVKRIYNNTSFIPDANGTLRLTYGYVKGYTPADAVYYSPISSLNGVIEKSYMEGDYTLPEKVYELYNQKDFGQFYNKKLGSVPVSILYNLDTTGGNSGSPILNAYGELIGVNFDRAYEATINDYAWNESYSRSIGVDIRYVLWITQKLGGADYILTELGI